MNSGYFTILRGFFALYIASFIAGGRRRRQSLGESPVLATLTAVAFAATVVATIDGVCAYREEE